ncbi:MAG: DNA repair helicase XPB [Dehalococcoidia bacterium]
MSYFPERPLIVQGDHTVLLEVENALHADARDALVRFAELEKSPEHVHTYRITPLSLWNAAASGASYDEIVGALERFSKYELPQNIVADIGDYLSRYGRLKLLRDDADQLILRSEDQALMVELSRNKRMQPFLLAPIDSNTYLVRGELRGHLKQALVQIGYPAEDLAGYVDGAPLPVAIRQATLGGKPFGLRDYQNEAADAFWAGGGLQGGSGVVVLPCGAGKTVVAMGAIQRAQTKTLIVCFGTTAAHQWIDELLDKTDLTPDMIGEYTGDQKDVRPVTVTTYQILTFHSRKVKATLGTLSLEDFPHLSLFTSQDWGLIIYDEVHLLPAPIFRITAEIQARRRLGLTATLVREDGREGDVFSLIGPKRYDVPWKILEQQGWIATANCWEIRVALPAEERMEYALAEEMNERHRLAAVNPAKVDVLRRLVAMHRDDHVLVIGQYLGQIERVATLLNAPLITGKTPNRERERLYAAFRSGAIPLLVVSKVGNFAIDLPSANVAIQLSGTFGSRQEEAQRLGRVLRPKTDGGEATFYSIVTRDTSDQTFAANRQLFLTEQGYRYTILDATMLLSHDPTESLST